jgi:hypothetical protein
MEGWKMCFNLPQGRLDMPMRSWMIWGCGFSNEDNNWRTQPHSSKPIYNHNHIFQRQCKLNTYYGRMARYKQWYMDWYQITYHAGMIGGNISFRLIFFLDTLEIILTYTNLSYYNLIQYWHCTSTPPWYVSIY